MSGRFVENGSFNEYERLLKEVHALIAAGGGESPEADDIRDRMEMAGSGLSPDEIARLKGLSADLYMLQDDETRQPSDAAETTGDRRAALQDAWESEDWSRGLALLRKNPPLFTGAQIAYLRFRAYAALGHLDTARVFIEYAFRQNPGNVTYACLLSDLLVRLRRLGEAAERAEAWLADPSSPPGLRIQAAGLLLRSAGDATGSEALSIHERVIGILQAALGSEESAADTPDLRTYGYVCLGTCFEAVGRIKEAHQAYDRALLFDPLHEGALVARALLRAAQDPERTVPDLEQAVASGTTLVAPYVHLARLLLNRGDYEQALTLSRRVLELSRRPELAATALHWAAIARFQLGAPTDLVRANFRTAMDLNPSDESIRSNFEAFERAVQARQAGHRAEPAWQRSRFDAHQEARRELQEHSPLVGVGSAL